MQACVSGAENWNPRAAEAELKRAVELNPSYADARALYSHLLNELGRPQEAMAQIDRATELDPFNPLIQAFRAVDLMWAHRYDEAIALCGRMLRTDPNSLVALMTIWEGSVLAGKPAAERFAAAKAYLKVMWGGSDLDAALDQGYAQGGYREAMRRAADILAARSRTTFVVPTDVAMVYLEAGQTAKSLDWVEKGLEAHNPTMVYLGVPYFDRLRGEPRFQAVLRRIGLPQ